MPAAAQVHPDRDESMLSVHPPDAAAVDTFHFSAMFTRPTSRALNVFIMIL